MIITKNWLNEWIDLGDTKNEEIISTLNSIGLEVASFKEIKIPHKIVVGHVKSKNKHENSDHLNICEVDIGSEVLQIVCGAKNVEAGQYVCVSLIGAVLPNGVEIKPAKLRGVESFGMLCSSVELGLEKMNDGLLLLDDSIGKLELGKELCEYSAFNDFVIEVELTPNRGDCLSVYGIARDLSAALILPMKEREDYEDADGLLGIGRILSVHCDEKIDISLSYRAFDVKDKLKCALLRMLRLSLTGNLKSDILDNYLSYTMHSTGVLFRAYDFNKICSQSNKIALKISKADSGEINVSCMDKSLGYIGINQNLEYKADQNSKTIIIEASYINPVDVSKAVMINKNLKGDEHLYRATRGSEPNLTQALKILFSILAKQKNIQIYAGNQSVSFNKEPLLISFEDNEISSMSGYEISRNEIVKILKRLGFEVSVEKDLINVKVPFFRHDISNSHDICEEIVRIIGIDNIVSKPLEFTENNRLNNAFLAYKNIKRIREKAAFSGFFECVNYIFDNESELSELGFKPCKEKLINPINNELNALRPTLLNHLLKTVERNYKNSKRSIKVFELSKAFDENGGESEKLAFVASGYKNEPSLVAGAKPEVVDFYYFATKVQNVIGNFKCEISENKIAFLSEFEQADIIQNGVKIGYIGRLDLKFENKRDLPKTYVCEIDFKFLDFNRVQVKEYSKFPSISRDLSILVPQDFRFERIKDCIDSLKIENLKEFFPVDIYSDDSLNGAKSVTIKLIFQDMQKTLEDEDIACNIQTIVDALKDRLNLALR